MTASICKVKAEAYDGKSNQSKLTWTDSLNIMALSTLDAIGYLKTEFLSSHQGIRIWR